MGVIVTMLSFVVHALSTQTSMGTPVVTLGHLAVVLRPRVVAVAGRVLGVGVDVHHGLALGGVGLLLLYELRGPLLVQDFAQQQVPGREPLAPDFIGERNLGRQSHAPAGLATRNRVGQYGRAGQLLVSLRRVQVLQNRPSVKTAASLLFGPLLLPELLQVFVLLRGVRCFVQVPRIELLKRIVQLEHLAHQFLLLVGNSVGVDRLQKGFRHGPAQTEKGEEGQQQPRLFFTGV